MQFINLLKLKLNTLRELCQAAHAARGGWDETLEANYRNHYDITNGPSDQCPGTCDHVKWRGHEALCGVGSPANIDFTHFTMFNTRPLLSVLLHRSYFITFYCITGDILIDGVTMCQHVWPGWLDPAHSPVPILHSLQSRAKTWQSVDLSPLSNSAWSFSSTFYGPEELGFQFNAISNFHFKVLLKILFTFLVAWERTGGNFARSNCQNALFCTPQCPDQRLNC